ncbi:MAG: adenylate/guanylate cyclase domain-containing protein [Planctomycetes bacterium]|nr:adenylate/guanylate cyclase domain-containing protein [Planctomycetota bacterium]
MYDASDPNAIHSEQREVTLLFADLRGFTELAGSLQMDPLVCELLAHVMDCLSEAVAHHDGLIVDYYGDGLMAMWNAPTNQPDHAELACRAGLQMLESLPTVTDEWMNVIQTQLRLGIGVHTGSVQVGNAGSTRKVKYGPRGPSVNLASRVESATKELRVPFVATRPTADRLSKLFATNRVCCARMPGLQKPVDLYAVRSANADLHTSFAWRTYDEALRQFEAGELEVAADTLATIDQTVAEVPWRFLGERVQCELGHKLRRRSMDQLAAYAGGVIVLSAK